MIRPFELGDHLLIEPNEHSKINNLVEVFFDDTFIKHTLEDEGEVKCILFWKQYKPRHYASFVLMAKNISTRNAMALKRFIENAKVKLKAKSIVTYSFNCDTLNRWHKFVGFKRQRNVIFNAGFTNYNKWVMQWA